ncbi:MAG: hypothetical protein SVV67_08965 [Bacillota bacterium]|nr:hypothetical protein [Bacillota bacterium]
MKKNKILIAIIVILVLVVAVLALMNRDLLAGKQGLVDNPGIAVKAGGEEVAKVYLDEIRSLGEEEFPIVLRSSGKEPRDLILTGVPLKRVLQQVDPTLLDGKEQVTVRAIDGYTVAYSMDEVLDESHLFVVYLEGGEPLGSKNEGGSGPLMIVPRKDEFGQRWCKFAVEVEVN